MTKLQLFLAELTIWMELLSTIVALTFFRKLKHTYWKYFVIYISVIFILEAISKFFLTDYSSLRRYYYDFFVIPIQFLFLFWLYSKKSLQKEKLFRFSCIIYLFFFCLHLFNLESIRMISSMSYTVGVIFLAIMVYLEFVKQIKSDEILNFNKNKMFYINIGVLLFYIGTLPFFSFDKILYENNKTIWSNYLTVFLFSVNLMYLLFAASFIWGKPKP